MLFLIPLSDSYAEPIVDVVKGPNRIETAIEISKRNFEESSSVILATGYNFSDATSAIHLAKQKQAPILLTAGESLEESLQDEIKRLNTKYVLKTVPKIKAF